MPERPPKFYKNPSIAVVLSFFWPGLGQIYNGEIGKGIAFLIAAGVSAGLNVGPDWVSALSAGVDLGHGGRPCVR